VKDAENRRTQQRDFVGVLLESQEGFAKAADVAQRVFMKSTPPEFPLRDGGSRGALNQPAG